jgi:hypothetical protein
MTLHTKDGLGLAQLRGLRAVALAGITALLVACGGDTDCTSPPAFEGGPVGSCVTDGGGTPSSTKLSVSLSSATVTAGAPATVTATVTNVNGDAISGQVVSFTTEAGLGEFSAPSALTNANGQAIVTLQPADSASAGADKVVAVVSVNGAASTASTGFQLTATQVTISSFTADIQTLQPYEQTALTVQLAGVSIGTPVSVQVSSSCVAASRATLTPAAVTTSTGVATFTYRDQGCGASNTADNLQASVTGAAANAQLQLNLTAPSVSSISFASAVPSTIYLRGSGFVENSNVTFRVLDVNGAGVPNADVTLEATTLTGGLLLEGGTVPVTRRSDANGNVIVRVNAGTVPTPVRIKATLTNTAISTVSSSLAIAVGLPSQVNFSLSQGTRNIEGFDIDGTRNTYSIIASDRLGNPVPNDTAINFVTEGGQVEAIRSTAIVNGLSGTVANFQSSSPRPSDGRITVTAYALGEESFLDTNGDNVYTPGEDYQDLGDVFLDRLFNGTFNAATDQFISLAIGGTDACATANSPLLARDVSIPSRTISDTGAPLATCVSGWNRAYVRRAIQTVLSTSAARPVYGLALPSGAEPLAGSSCPAARSLISSYAANDQPVIVGVYDFGSVQISGAGKTGVINLFASDANPVAFNPMAAGTSIGAAATDGMTATVLGGSPVPSTGTPSAVSVAFAFDDNTSSGVVTVTFRSPSGLQTSVSQSIKRGAPVTTCP